MIIRPSQKKIIEAKKVIDDVKKEIRHVEKNYDNDIVDINSAKGEVEIVYNSGSKLSKPIDEGAYRAKVYEAKISRDSETGELKEASATTSRQLRNFERYSHYNYLTGKEKGFESLEVAPDEETYSLKESRYKEVTEKSLLGKEKKKEVYTQFEDGKSGEETFTRIEVDKKTAKILDVDTSKGSSALKEARKEFSQIDDKRLLINSKDPDFKVGKFTNEEMRIAGAVMARVKDDMELAKKYDNVKQYEVVRWVDGEDKDTRPGEIDLPETRLVGENDALGRLGPYMKRLVDKVKMSFDPATGDVKNAEISTYTKIPRGANATGFSRYEEKPGSNGKTVSVYFSKEKGEYGTSHTTVEVDKNTGELLNVKHFDGSEFGKINKNYHNKFEKVLTGSLIASCLGIVGSVATSLAGYPGIAVSILMGSIAAPAGVVFIGPKLKDLMLEKQSDNAYPKDYLEKLKTEEKEAKKAEKKAEKEAKEAKEKDKEDFETSKRNESATRLKSRVDNVMKGLARYDNEKADLNPEKGKVLIDEAYNSAIVNPNDGEYAYKYKEIVRQGKLSSDSETGEIKNAEVLTDGKTFHDHGGTIYKYEEKGTFLGLGKKKEVHTYYHRDYDGEYYSTATIDKESGDVHDFKEWSCGKVFDGGGGFSGTNFLKKFTKPLEAMKMKHQLKKKSL